MDAPSGARKLPRPRVDYLATVRLMPRFQALSSSDFSILQGLRRELLETGAIERTYEERPQQTSEDLDEMMAEARAAAKSERELNPAFFDEELDASLGRDLSEEEDWENPSLTEVDELGRAMYDGTARTYGIP